MEVIYESSMGNSYFSVRSPAEPKEFDNIDVRCNLILHIGCFSLSGKFE